MKCGEEIEKGRKIWKISYSTFLILQSCFWEAALSFLAYIFHTFTQNFKFWVAFDKSKRNNASNNRFPEIPFCRILTITCSHSIYTLVIFVLGYELSMNFSNLIPPVLQNIHFIIILSHSKMYKNGINSYVTSLTWVRKRNRKSQLWILEPFQLHKACAVQRVLELTEISKDAI